jgi:DNA modification methylase
VVPSTCDAYIIRGNALTLPLPDASVDLIVTSPPYFALRDYKDGDASLDGQIGAEATPAEFLAALWACAQEWWRVLKPSGSLWVNLGDKYSGPQAQNTKARSGDDAARTWQQTNPKNSGIRNKSLMGLPWRYAIGMVDGEGDPDGIGWVLRAEVIWAKPNGLPESVRDRVARKHEQWFHFTKSERYFAAVDEIRERTGNEADPTEYAKHLGTWTPDQDKSATARGQQGMHSTGGKTAALTHPLGKLPGSVWSVATEPLRVPDELNVQHFAAFPTEWPRRIILGWAPTRGVCTACNEGRRPGNVCACTETIATPTGRRADADPSKSTGRAGFNRPRGTDEGTVPTSRHDHNHWAAELRDSPHRPRIEKLARRLYGPAVFAHWIRTDYPNGARPIPVTFREALLRRGWLTEPPAFVAPPTTPAVVLDPFGGTGTTAAAAKSLGCIGVSVDLSAAYCRLAEWRCNGDGFEKVDNKVHRRKPKPKRKTKGPQQLSLGSE